MPAAQVLMTTTVGPITLELDADNAPKTVENFLSYVSNGFYDGTIFHRVIDNFMIQGGGFDADMSQKETGAPIENEANNGLKNLRGSIAMARTQDPHSATAQFFINVKDNDFLNHTGEKCRAGAMRFSVKSPRVRTCWTKSVAYKRAAEPGIKMCLSNPSLSRALPSSISKRLLRCTDFSSATCT